MGAVTVIWSITVVSGAEAHQQSDHSRDPITIKYVIDIVSSHRLRASELEANKAVSGGSRIERSAGNCKDTT